MTTKYSELASLAPNTQKSYERAVARYINWFNKGPPPKDFADMIETYRVAVGSDASYKQFLAAVRRIDELGYDISPEDKQRILEKTTPLLEQYRKKINENSAKNLAKKTDKNKIFEWKTIVEKTKEVYDKLDSFERLLAQLYIFRPPRRLEYASLFYYRNAEYKPEEFKNKVYQVGDKFKFALGDYKTQKTYGIYEFEVDVDSDLGKALNNYVVHRVLSTKIDVDDLAKPNFFMRLFNLLENSFGVALTRLMNNIMGEPINLNMLRHNYITSFMNRSPHPTLEEKIKLSREMGHSVVVQMEYVKYAPED